MVDQQAVADYIREFPYQDTFEYVAKYTGGDPARLNTWVLGQEPVLVKAGQDRVVRMNNDTFYKMAFVDLSEGPVTLAADAGDADRFVSFQLMDDRNANYRNVIGPSGRYVLHTGPAPGDVDGEAIEVPSTLSVVIVRVEVKNKNDAADRAIAEKLFATITIDGPTVTTFPTVERLSKFGDDVAAEALRQIDQAFADLPFLDCVVGPGQEPGDDVPFLNHAAGTKGGWGGPGPEHSAYATIFTDAAGATLDGSRGTYSVTTTAPPVDAFWSVTVYDTARGGYLHPNADDRYHINDTTAVANPDGTITFTFTADPAVVEAATNGLEVPAGPFDLAVRYYLPREPIASGDWTFPGVQLTP